MSDEFRERVIQELNRRNWSHSQLAQFAGVSRPLVSRTLSGDISPSADFCIKVATALEVSPVMLLRLADHLSPESPDSKTLQEIIELARNLSPTQQKQLLDYTRFIYQNRE